MDTIIEKLLALQDKDIRVFNLKKQIDSIPEEKNQSKQILLSHEEESGKAKNDMQEIEKKIKTIEMDIAGHREKIRNIHSKSTEIKKNDDYRAYLKEVDNFTFKIKELEDSELELWEKLETAKTKKVKAEKALEAAKARVQSSSVDLDVKEKNCRELIEKMLQERRQMLEGIPAVLLSSYERYTAVPNAAGAFRKGVVPVQNENCGGCFLKVTPQVRAKIRRREPTVCENCGTLLYSGE